MAKNDEQGREGNHRFAYLNEMHLGGIERQVDAGEYISGPELAAALRKHGSRPIPADVLGYLCLLLEGKVLKPKGRKAIREIEERRRLMFLRYGYRRYLAWLQTRKKRYGGLEGWSTIREADWWQGPPNERAARMVAHRWLYGAESWRSVHNRVSSRK